MKITTRLSLKFWHDLPSRSICGFSSLTLDQQATYYWPPHRQLEKQFWICPQGSQAGISCVQGRS